MSALLIAYDLNKPGQDYTKLYEEIRSLGAWWHHLDSTWIVDTYSTVEDVSSRLRAVMDESDRFLVLDVTAAKRGGWLTQDAWDWLSEHI